MKSATAFVLGVLVVAGLFFVTNVAGGKGQTDTATVSAQAAAPQPAASGQYKIGVVSRKAVLDGYKKVKADYDKLQADVNTRQKEIDKLSEKIQKAKDAYEKEKDSLGPAERGEREAAVQSDYRQYQAELQTEQANIDSKERLLMKKVFSEIDEVVQRIGTEQGYHLILDGSSRSGAIYFSPTIDISQKVIDELNAKS